MSLPPKNFYEFKNSKIASRGMRITLPQRIHLQLHVSTGDALSSDQTEIIGDIEQGMVLDVSLTANGTEIHSFNGKVTVSVPFTWTQQGVLQDWYLADDGKTKELVEVAYRGGNAVLTLKHFSTYAIVVKANDPDSGIVSMGENKVTVQKQADAVYYAAALYVEDGRFLAYAASEAAEDEETVTLKWAPTGRRRRRSRCSSLTRTASPSPKR